MNIYKFELKNVYKSIITSTLIGVSFLVLLCFIIYPVFSKSKSDLQVVLNGFPPEFAAMFMGSSLDDLFSYNGFYTFGFMYLSIMGAYFASALGASIFAREKRAKCMDFLISKPISRASVFLAKLCVGLSGIAIYNVFYITLGVILGKTIGNENLISNSILAHSSMFFIQIIFLAIGIFAGVFFKKIRSISGTAIAISLGAFILSMLYHLVQEESLRYVSIYNYFDITLAFKSGTYEWQYCLLAAVIVLSLIGGAFVKYNKSDIHCA